MPKSTSLIVLFLICQIAFGQKITEKLISRIDTKNSVSAYSFTYDNKSGGWSYDDYDTSAKTSVLLTAQGKSIPFSGTVSSYSSVFDASGNVYTTAYNLVNDSVYTYFLLKNTDVIGTYGFISDVWIAKDGNLYFYIKDSTERSYFAVMDLSTGSVSLTKPYQEVFFVYTAPGQGDEEPIMYPGFTSDGKVYYGAMLDSMKFLVIGGVEQKHYREIDDYNCIIDKNGSPTYVANDSPSWSDSTHTTAYVVQGTNEYKKFDYVNGPIIFDKNNNPIYVGGESAPDGSSTTLYLMQGNTQIGKKYNGNITNVQFTPSGKLAFVGGSTPTNGEYAEMVVVDGKEGKRYNSITDLSFLPGDEPLYTATVKDKQVIVKGDEKVSSSFSSILSKKLLPDGDLCYVGADWGDYDKGISDKYYIHIGDDSYGPYDMLSVTGNNGEDYVAVDDKGNYAFVVSKLVDKKNYVYSYSVYTNERQSASFDAVDNVMLCGGKTVFMGYKYTDRKNYIQKNKLYIDMKEVSADYDGTTNVVYDKAMNTLSFIGVRGNEVYQVEVKL